MPTPKRSDVLAWLKKIWDDFLRNCVQFFRGSGCVFEVGIDYSGDTESASDTDA